VDSAFALVLGATLPIQALAADPPKATPSASAASIPAVPAAPFGLEWGLSKEEVEARSIKLSEAPTSEGSQRFSAT
jgi:hypothetical protein